MQGRTIQRRTEYASESRGSGSDRASSWKLYGTVTESACGTPATVLGRNVEARAAVTAAGRARGSRRRSRRARRSPGRTHSHAPGRARARSAGPPAPRRDKRASPDSAHVACARSPACGLSPPTGSAASRGAAGVRSRCRRRGSRRRFGGLGRRTRSGHGG